MITLNMPPPLHSRAASWSMLLRAHSGQMMFSPSWGYDSSSETRICIKLTWMNPLPTMEPLQMLQMKHSLCHARLSNATNLVLPSPSLPEADMLMMSIQNKQFAWLSSPVCFYRLLCAALTLSADKWLNAPSILNMEGTIRYSI